MSPHNTHADALDSSARVVCRLGLCPDPIGQNEKGRDGIPTYAEGGVSFIDCNVRDADDLS